MTERPYQDLVCPDCGGALIEVKGLYGRRWYCQQAIGEVGCDVWGHPYRPDDSPHRRVRAWSEKDGCIRQQLAEYKTFIRVERGKKAA